MYWGEIAGKTEVLPYGYFTHFTLKTLQKCNSNICKCELILFRIFTVAQCV